MCKLKKTTDKPLLFLCLRTNNTENKSSLGKSDKEVVWDNIHTKYNFRIQPVDNSEEFTMKKNGSMIRINYPTKLDFNKADSIQIHLIMSNPENTQGIKLNPDSEELKCEQPDNRTKVCSVPKSHFKENGNYYIHYLNGDSKLTTFYEISPILVSLPKPEEPKTEKKSNLAGIIAGSVIGGLALIGIIVFFVVRYYKRKKISINDFSGKNENLFPCNKTQKKRKKPKSKKEDDSDSSSEEEENDKNSNCEKVDNGNILDEIDKEKEEEEEEENNEGEGEEKEEEEGNENNEEEEIEKEEKIKTRFFKGKLKWYSKKKNVPKPTSILAENKYLKNKY